MDSLEAMKKNEDKIIDCLLDDHTGDNLSWEAVRALCALSFTQMAIAIGTLERQGMVKVSDIDQSVSLSFAAREIARLTAENRALQAKVDEAMAIEAYKVDYLDSDDDRAWKQGRKATIEEFKAKLTDDAK